MITANKNWNKTHAAVTNILKKTQSLKLFTYASYALIYIFILKYVTWVMH